MLEGSYQGFIYQPTGPETPTGTSPHLGPSSSPAPQPTSAAYSANNKPDHRHPQHYYRDSYDSAASSNSTNSSNSIGGYYLTQPPAQHYQLPMPASAGNAYEPKSPMFPGRKSDHSDGMILSYPPPPHPQPHHRHQHHDNSSSWSIRPDVGGNSNSNDGGGYSWNYSPPVRPLTLSSPTHAVRGGKSYSSNTETRAGLGGYGDDDTLSPIPKPLVLDQAPGFPPRHKLTTTVWEDEGTVCYQVDAKGICVARRADNHMVNGTKLLNVVGMSRGKRDGILKNERGRIVIKVGAMHLKGVWIALHRAKYLANKFHVCDALYPLFEDNPRKFVHPPSPVISRTLVGRSSNDKQTFWSDTNNGNGPNKRAPLPSIIDQQQGASRGPDPHQHPHTHPLDTTGSIHRTNMISSPPTTLSLPRPQSGYQAIGYYYHHQPQPRPETPAEYTRPHHLFQNTGDPRKAIAFNPLPDRHQQHKDQPIKLSYDPVINSSPKASDQSSSLENGCEHQSCGDP